MFSNRTGLRWYTVSLYIRHRARFIDLSASQFIVSKYPSIKQHNPDLPVLIREATGTPARVFARFGASGIFCISSSKGLLTDGQSEEWRNTSSWTIYRLRMSSRKLRCCLDHSMKDICNGSSLGESMHLKSLTASITNSKSLLTLTASLVC